jgi:hypothetical protein
MYAVADYLMSGGYDPTQAESAPKGTSIIIKTSER